MAMTPVHNPPNGPVTAPLNGMFVGKSVYVFGKINSDADRFMVNLVCGDSIESSDVALHLNPRFPAKQVVRNTRINGVWGAEERSGGFPFVKGEYFSFKITCAETNFVIEANDGSFTTYNHRLPYKSITHVNVGQQCQAILVTSEINNAEIAAAKLSKPASGTLLIPFYNVAGRKIQIAGKTTNLDSVGIAGTAFNLLAENGDIILHYNPRGKAKEIVRNSKIGGAWGPEEKSLSIPFPFQKDVPFQTTISITDKDFVVTINGSPAFTYANRAPNGIAQIRNLQISAAVKLESITYY